MSDTGQTGEGTSPAAFGGSCGLAAALGREDAGHPRWQRTIDGRRVHFHSGLVRVVSYAFTGRIRRALAADES